MANNNPFESLRNVDSNKSVQWYQTQIKNLRGISPAKIMQNTPDLVNKVVPGRMYMFFYEAKLKDKLPYWDTFPLVLPFKLVPGGFYGINLHYLPYIARFKLLGALSEYANDESTNDDTKLLLSWKVLNGSSKLNMIKPCVKHYLFDQLQSRFLQIKYPDWVTASQLPVERFEKANKNQVWRESRAKY